MPVSQELFKLLFGNPSESLLDEPLDGPDESVYMQAVLAHPAAKGGAASRKALATYCEATLIALFNTEVAKQLSMDKYKTAKFVPAPVPASDIATAVAAALPSGDFAAGLVPSREGPGWDRKVWSPAECIRELCACVAELWGDVAKSSLIGTFAFDKDDKIAMRFVAAAANLRGSVFKIESLCFHDVKVHLSVLT